MLNFFFLLNNEIRKKENHRIRKPKVLTKAVTPVHVVVEEMPVVQLFNSRYTYFFHDTIEFGGNFRSHLASPVQNPLIALLHLLQGAFFFLFNFAFGIFASRCCCLVTWSCRTLGDPWRASLTFACSSSLRLMSIVSGMPSSHPILCVSLFLPSIFPSIRVFSILPILLYKSIKLEITHQ